MHVAIWVVSLASAVIAVTGVCRRFDLSAPVTLIVVGMGASYLPFVPEVHLTAEVVLLGLLPPLLYSAALQTSLVDFTANKRPILLLAIGLVAFTALGVGALLHWLIPGLTWPAAFAIGAVVAPPDAVAATTIARRIGLPRRLVSILEGESLLNDATALVALSTALLAAKEEFSLANMGLDFLRVSVIGVAVGLLVFVGIGWVRKHVSDPVMDTSVSLVTPFIAYVLAEELHASGVLAVVVAGLLLGHKAPILQTAGSRIAERLNWHTISFILENLVFLLIGLQARWILADVADSSLSTGRIVLVCAAALVAVIVLRMAWVFPARYLLVRPAPDASGKRPPATHTFVLGWAGMRGVVTLAAAFVIPESFPHHEVLLLIALVVTAGTLFLQGLTLPYVVKWLKVPAPDPREDALARAGLFQQATAAGLVWLNNQEETDDPHQTRAMLRHRVEQRDFAAWERLGTGEVDSETPSEAYARMRLQMLQAERARVLQIRSEGRVPHEVVEDVLRALDVEESMIDVRMERNDQLRTAVASVGTAVHADTCDHLDEAAPVQPTFPERRECVDCIAEGTTWVHLRVCLHCNEIRCCDSSPRRHTTAHFHATGHPVVQSAEPDEGWRWCYVDELLGA
ncbi:MAG TPA: Na+/H+ antiporter [Nocardioidaceae bacterium]|nr:Na+/H+ antiporter [Nocardioidaceae bacterium]